MLDGMSLEVERCDRLVIMGQSGSGKSTILRLILGILQPEAGSVFLSTLKSLGCIGASYSAFGSILVWFTSIRRC